MQQTAEQPRHRESLRGKLARWRGGIWEWIRGHRELTAALLLLGAVVFLFRYGMPLYLLAFVVVAVLLFSLFISKPAYLFYLFITSLLLTNYVRLGVFTTGVWSALILAVVTTAYYATRRLEFSRRMPRVFDYRFLLVFLVLVAFSISTLVNGNIGRHFFPKILSWLVGYIFVRIYVKDQRGLLLLLVVIFIARSIDGGYGVYQYLLFQPDRVAGTFHDPNEYACFNVTALAIAGFLLAYSKNWLTRLLIILGVCLMLAGVILSKSRSGFIILAAIGILVIINPALKVRLRFMLIIVAVLIIGIVATGIYWQRIQSVQSFLTEGAPADRSISIRTRLIGQAWQVFLENPVFGVGYGHFRFYNLGREGGYSKYVPFFDQHNMFMSILSEYGLLGAITSLILFVVGFLDGFRAVRYARRAGDRQLALLCSAALMTYLALLMFGMFLNPSVIKMIFIYVALPISAYEIVCRRYPRITGTEGAEGVEEELLAPWVQP
jgi:O-antigen ligase